MKLITDCIALNATGWDEAGGGYGNIQLYDAVLRIDTPQFKAGTKVDSIAFLWDESRCVIYNAEGETVDSFPLTLTIGT